MRTNSNPAPDLARLPPRGSLARSVALFRAFRVEQSDPDRFYSLLAADTVREVAADAALADASVLDVGGGPGYFADAFRAAGARYAGIDPNVGELSLRGGAPEGFLRASGMALPLVDGGLDVALSSNVLEHVPDPELMADEMVRVVRPGGLVWLSWTTWLSPWGGHETAPWHYLGGRRAADRLRLESGESRRSGPARPSLHRETRHAPVLPESPPWPGQCASHPTQTGQAWLCHCCSSPAETRETARGHSGRTPFRCPCTRPRSDPHTARRRQTT